MVKREIDFSFSGHKLMAYDYSIIMQDKISRTPLANGSIRTTVAGKPMNTITVKALLPCGRVSQFYSAFLSLIGKQSQILSIDGHTMSATLDKYELTPYEEPGLLQVALTFH